MSSSLTLSRSLQIYRNSCRGLLRYNLPAASASGLFNKFHRTSTGSLTQNIRFFHSAICCNQAQKPSGSDISASSSQSASSPSSDSSSSSSPPSSKALTESESVKKSKSNDKSSSTALTAPSSSTSPQKVKPPADPRILSANPSSPLSAFSPHLSVEDAEKAPLSLQDPLARFPNLRAVDAALKADLSREVSPSNPRISKNASPLFVYPHRARTPSPSKLAYNKTHRKQTQIVQSRIPPLDGEEDDPEDIVNWRISGAYVVERLPVTLPGSQYWEEDYFKMATPLKQREQLPFPAEIIELERQHAERMEEERIRDGRPKPPPVQYGTNETDDDRAGEFHSLNRSYDHSLFLLIKKRRDAFPWQFPSQPWTGNPKEPLRRTAERAVLEMCGTKLEVIQVGNHPIACYRYKYSDEYRKLVGGRYKGAKVFLFHALYLKGPVIIDETYLHDYSWLTSHQLESYLPQNVFPAFNVSFPCQCTGVVANHSDIVQHVEKKSQLYFTLKKYQDIQAAKAAQQPQQTNENAKAQQGQ